MVLGISGGLSTYRVIIPSADHKVSYSSYVRMYILYEYVCGLPDRLAGLVCLAQANRAAA